MPAPLVMVKVAPAFVHEPVALYATGNPEDAVAATVKLVPLAAVAGAGVVTVIVWFTFCALVVLVTCGAGLKLMLPAWLY